MLFFISVSALGQFLQQWAGAAQALAIVAALPLLAVYVWKSWRIASSSARLASAATEAAAAMKTSALESQQTLREVQAARIAESAPYVIAYLDITEEHLLYAVVKNIGPVPARDVCITFKPPLSANGTGAQSWDLPAFLAAPIPFFPPQYELRSILGVSLELFAEKSSIPTVYEVEIRYRHATSQAERVESYTLDLGVFRNARSGRSTALTDIHAILKEVEGQQRLLADGVDAVRDLLSEPTAPPAASLPDPGRAAATSEERVAQADLPPPPQPDEAASAARATPPATSAHATSEESDDLTRICRTWRSLGERRRWESAGSLQRHLREAGSGTPGWAEDGRAVSTALEEVLRHRFYLDGGQSLRAFDGAVDRLIAALDSGPPARILN